ncbi:urease accessory protein UreD [Herbihabitans rhizosphaerae]|uniref:urease accessory protein UreD n=1 Tax=Herbihabitans rhizosphaerae TaxID=1872711 RepID=UPI003BF81A2C
MIRELRSAAPLTLVPQRRRQAAAVVHLVSSACAPLGGDELVLDVRVGAGATLRLAGVAATVALPGQHAGPSRTTVRVDLEGALEYLPEPTVVTARADHTAVLTADLSDRASLRWREILVLGRSGESPGRCRSGLSVRRAGRPVLRQQLDIGDRELDASPAGLAGKRVSGTGLLLDGSTPAAAGGPWWSRVPIDGGALTTVLADDVVSALAVLTTSMPG